MNKPLITNIQKYSIHDGAGIRTTVFFKGCPLSCRWCHNPETQSFSKQLMFQAERCTGCGSCIEACQATAIFINNGISVTNEKLCTQCGMCSEYCLQNIREISGKHYTVDELVREVEKDKAFYEQSEGGITFSGGEVLAQDIDYLEKLIAKLHQKGFRVNIDTCGYAPYERIKRILPYVDTFLYDVKIIDPELHIKYTGVNNTIILDNLSKLNQEGASLWIRIPVIGGVNDTIENMEQTARFLKDKNISVKQINLLPYHNIASDKYKRLNREYTGAAFYIPTEDELGSFAAVFKKYGFDKIKIGG